MINTHTGYKSQSGVLVPPINIEDYPAVKEHLDKFYSQLSVRQDKGITPYNLRSCIYMEDFSKQKIVWGEISDKSKFALDDKCFYTEATTFFLIGGNLKYLLAMLNSKLLEWYFNQLGTATGVGTNRWKKYTIEKLPIILPNQVVNNVINLLVNELIEERVSVDTKYLVEEKINNIIYELYELSEHEISHIKNIKI